MKKFWNKKDDKVKKVKVGIKEGERILIERTDEDGNIIQEALEDLEDKKEKTEDDESEKKSILDKVKKPVVIAAAVAAGIGIGTVFTRSKKGSDQPADNGTTGTDSGFEESAE